MWRLQKSKLQKLAWTIVSFFQVVLSEEMELMLQAMLYTAKAITDMMDWILPAVGQLQNFMINIQELNLVANNEFKQVCKLTHYPHCIHWSFYVRVMLRGLVL